MIKYRGGLNKGTADPNIMFDRRHTMLNSLLDTAGHTLTRDNKTVFQHLQTIRLVMNVS